jgi:hypothetical protein
MANATAKSFAKSFNLNKLPAATWCSGAQFSARVVILLEI